MNDPSSYSGVIRLLQTILPKTRVGQAAWKNDGTTLKLQLPVATIALKAEEADQGFDVAVILPTGGLLGQVKFSERDPNYSVIRELYKAALEASWNSLTEEVQKIVLQDQMVGIPTTTQTTTTLPPDFPEGATIQQAEGFFQKIQGDWHLEYLRGQEDCHIDLNGNYSYGHQAGATATPAKARFRLELLACSANGDLVEVAKVEPNGRTFQIEVLNITEKEMAGYAKHDGHKLKYTRRGVAQSSLPLFIGQ